MTDRDSSRISPTAHYTGQVWQRNGLAPPELDTLTGRLMFQALRAPMWLGAFGTGGVTLEILLLQRHRIIDHLLERAIAEGKVAQVVEIAAGLSGRGLRFARRHAGRRLLYIEGDLPDMVARKRALLARVRQRPARHELLTVDALADSGPDSLAEAVAPRLEAGRGTAVITEGLLSYFPAPAVQSMWRRFARLITGAGGGGLYLTDVHLQQGVSHTPAVRLFQRLLSVFTRGAVQVHFTDPEQVVTWLGEAGFAWGEVHRPADMAAALDLRVGRRGDAIAVAEAWMS